MFNFARASDNLQVDLAENSLRREFSSRSVEDQRYELHTAGLTTKKKRREVLPISVLFKLPAVLCNVYAAASVAAA